MSVEYLESESEGELMHTSATDVLVLRTICTNGFRHFAARVFQRADYYYSQGGLNPWPCQHS